MLLTTAMLDWPNEYLWIPWRFAVSFLIHIFFHILRFGTFWPSRLAKVINRAIFIFEVPSVYVGHRRYHGFPHFFLDDARIIQWKRPSLLSEKLFLIQHASYSVVVFQFMNQSSCTYCNYLVQTRRCAKSAIEVLFWHTEGWHRISKFISRA
jgi:hypothetical protein